MRRVLNSFLIFIERMRSNSLIIAATNHGDRLDKALFRRFDDLIEFGLPKEEQFQQTIKTLLTGVTVGRLSWKRLLPAPSGLSYSEITRASEETIKPGYPLKFTSFEQGPTRTQKGIVVLNIRHEEEPGGVVTRIALFVPFGRLNNSVMNHSPLTINRQVVPALARSEPPEGGTPYTPPRFMAPIRVNSFDISPRKTVAR